MLKLLPYILLWSGLWSLYFPLADRYPFRAAPSVSPPPTANAPNAPRAIFTGYNPIDYPAYFSQKTQHGGTAQAKDAWKAWFALSGMAMLSFAFWVKGKDKKKQQYKDRAVFQKISELEQAALRSQMNPHFIFNCLNSIQLLILKEDMDGAMRYLTRFSRLLRATLEASLTDEATLSDEVQMLTDYFDLEKLRFKEAFQFEINIHPAIDQYETVLPPLILQPYVENALVHGMANKVAGGKVSVNFGAEKGYLLATITDNGPGIYSKKTTGPAHQSVGMTLTRRRLELLDKNRDDALVRVQEIVGENGQVAGTRVAVRIPQLVSNTDGSPCPPHGRKSVKKPPRTQVRKAPKKHPPKPRNMP